MKQYTITPISGTPDWSRIPALDVDYVNWTPPVDVAAKVQICYDKKGLYLHLRAWETDIRAEENTPLSSICDDSCLEFFFRPEETDPRYFNIEVNPLGFSYVGLGSGRASHCRLAPDYAVDIFEKQINRLEDGWEVYLTVSAHFVQIFFPEFELTPGKKIYANCFKCGDAVSVPHYLSWSPCLSTSAENADFHIYQDFGLMILG